MSFEEDLATAMCKEEQVRNVLLLHMYIDDLTIKGMEYCDTHEYDIAIDTSKGLFTYEVKFDIIASETGNVGVAFMCNDKPSGIDRTEAIYWVHCFDKQMYMLTTSKLRKLIKSKSYFRIAKGGDKDYASMYLFKKDFFILQSVQL